MQKTTVMNTYYFLPVVHPAFELLKRSAKLLHFIAASVILVNAWHAWNEHGAATAISVTQGIIAVDIYLLIFFGGDVLREAPRLNLIFRLIEALAIFGIASSLLTEGHSIFGMSHFLLSGGYAFLFYREWRVIRSEGISIRPTGIMLPNFLKDAEISWADIKAVNPQYHHFCIETYRNKRMQFNLRQNLRIDELQQIDEFCRQHMSGQQV